MRRGLGKKTPKTQGWIGILSEGQVYHFVPSPLVTPYRQQCGKIHLMEARNTAILELPGVVLVSRHFWNYAFDHHHKLSIPIADWVYMRRRVEQATVHHLRDGTQCYVVRGWSTAVVLTAEMYGSLRAAMRRDHVTVVARAKHERAKLADAITELERDGLLARTPSDPDDWN